MNLRELANSLRDGSLPLFEAIEQWQAQFEAREPDVQAFLPEEKRFERIRREAQGLLNQYLEPASRPPLFGVPLGVKDIFHVHGFETRAGSELPPPLLQGAEAKVVTALKQAGVLILGKTVTTEFAYFAPGPTRNPHQLGHTPGGSSSGSAAAVAAGLCPLALGTQTIGSINRPAAFCGVVGVKPSYDRISRQGVIPLSPSLDHVGFFTPGAAGAQYAAALVCSRWQPQLTKPIPVLGIPRGPYLEGASAEGLTHFRDVCQRLIEAGVRVKTVPAMPDFDQIVARHEQLLAAEAAAVHADWFTRYGNRYHEKTAALLKTGEGVSPEAAADARAGRQQLRETLLHLMDRHEIDLWIAPAAPGSAPEGLASTGDPIMNLPWTQSGLPTVTLPAGVNEAGLPLAVQLIGRWYEDEALLDWAERIEDMVR